jgi:hypothetical protein
MKHDVRTRAEQWKDVRFIGPFMATYAFVAFGIPCGFSLSLLLLIALPLGCLCGIAAYFGEMTIMEQDELDLRRNAEVLKGEPK